MITNATKEERERYKDKFKVICHKFLKNRNSSYFLKTHSNAVDILIMKLWADTIKLNNMSLIAVGGYARQELFPYSDIDFLILYDGILVEKSKEMISAFIASCWDAGLTIGHSVRNMKEVKEEFHADITTATNLIESRLICGSDKLFQKFNVTINKALSIKKFYKDKNIEQSARHKKYKDSAYQLEPNIKESPGGLRDMHMTRWISSSQKMGGTFLEMFQSKLIDKKEYEKIRFHENNISKRRILLHILSKSTDDRLVFDVQNELAKSLGYISKDNKKPSEILMKSYYKSVNYIILFNEIIIKRLDPSKRIKKSISHPLSLHLSGDLIEIDKKDLHKLKPYLFDIFQVFQQHNEAKGFGPNLLGALNSEALKIDRSFRNDQSKQAAFLKILKGKNKVNRSLRIMNKCNILGQFIPMFGKIVAQMQHDLFHIYTVDEHTLNVVENLRRFSKLKLKHEFPDCYEKFKLFKKPDILYLAAIFHDIAKGRGGDHSELGALDAERFCKKINLPKEDCLLVKWLVKSHLKMSQVAQKSDLSDPLVINNFREFVSNQTRLDALYLLTVADIRATSPLVWNEWKATLLKELYSATQISFKEESKTVKQIIFERKERAIKILLKYDIKPSRFKALWEQLGNDYFLRFNEQEISWQTRFLIPYASSKQPIVKAHLCSNGNSIEVLVYVKDNNSLFAKIANFFHSIRSDIVQAKVFTTKHGYALDVFNILDKNKTNLSYEKFFTYIENELTNVIKNHHIDNAVDADIKTRQAMHHKIDTKILFNPIGKERFEFQIVTDLRPGLLSLIANEINNLGLSIDNAKINSLGQRAEDFFIIRSGNEKISINNIQLLTKNIKRKLLAPDD